MLEIIKKYLQNSEKFTLIEEELTNCYEKLGLGCNFIIIPLLKRIEEGEQKTIRKVIYECLIVNKNTKIEQWVNIDTDWLLDAYSFQKQINKLVGLSLWGYEKGLKPWLNDLKKMFDLLETNGLLSVEKDICHLGYSKLQNEIVFSNGILNLEKKEFTEHTFHNIRTPFAIKFQQECEMPLDESLGILGNLGKQILTQSLHDFIFTGFLGSAIMSNELFSHYKSFPQLYIYGQRGCGKSFLLKVLMIIVGFMRDELVDLSKITKFALTDIVGNVSYFCFLDEYSDSSHKRWNDSVLKGNYDRMSTPRGTVNDRGANTIYFKNESVLIYGGESLSNNEALITRTICIDAEKGFTLQLDRKQQKDLIKTYRNTFFNILRQKKELNINTYIDKAEELLEKNNIIINEQRIRNNVLVLLIGNIILKQEKENFLVESVNSYLSSYTQISKINNTVQDILSDIDINPEAYISLDRHFKADQHFSLFIYNNHLLIGLRTIVGIYGQRFREKDVDRTKLVNEFKLLLGIKGKIEDQMVSYIDFNGNRSKLLGIPYNKVIENEYLINLWNTIIRKITHDKGSVSIFISAEHDEKINSFLEKHTFISPIGESEKYEKDNLDGYTSDYE